MAEEFQRNKQYSYDATSSLVIDSSRDRVRRRNEGTGEVESLKGHLDGVRMGDRIDHNTAEPSLDSDRRKRSKDSASGSIGPSSKRKKASYGFTSQKGILEASLEAEGISYRPQTADTRSAYGEILSLVQASVGEQPSEIIRGAADEVILLLKATGQSDARRQQDIRGILGASLTDVMFSQLVSLGKRLVDFTESSQGGLSDSATGSMGADVGVAVEFDSDASSGSGDSDSDSDASVTGGAGDGAEGNSSALRREGTNLEADGVDDDGGQLSVHSIDAHWLQRKLGEHYSDANESADLTREVMTALHTGLADERSCENALVDILGFDKFPLVALLMRNRARVYFCTRLKQAADGAERRAVEAAMSSDSEEGRVILQELQSKASAQNWASDRMGQLSDSAKREMVSLKEGKATETSLSINDDDGDMSNAMAMDAIQQPTRMVDLDPPAFRQGGRLMTSSSCELPATTWRAQKKGYEEVHVPAVKPVISVDEKLVEITSLPQWSQPAFPGIKTLNRIQSRMVDSALYSQENLLLCAPTGAGKTNVALMCILQQLSQYRRPDGSFDTDAFKVVYVAPMKALVQENVLNFGKKLEPFGINVRELSGDQNLTKAQIEDTQVIVTTPEKWDIVTRKAGDRAYTQLVRLVIIDEIHLLHDERGPVLEALVSRVLRQVETTQEVVRLVGLSATLPNFEDVASFLRVNPEKGLFFFDSTFRPVPLQQQFIGITEKKALKRFQLMNEICYEKVLQQAGKNQVLIFTHSRADTVKTAQALRDLAASEGTLDRFVAEGSATAEILHEEADAVKNNDLADLLKSGFAVHHAGLSKGDRSLVEDLFSDKHLQVLVSTATLAWGVNLPCHTVILKGTQMYSPEQGRWTELSPLDVMQMLGRAGRYGLDTEGEGIILTQHSELQYYLTLLNQQLPIESQMQRRLADMLNAEVVLGTVTSIKEAATWLGYSYLFIRMLRNPQIYNVAEAELERDPGLMQQRLNMAHTAATALEKSSLVKYDRKSGVLQTTTLGRVASHYYISHDSMRIFAEHMRPSMSDIEVFRLFSLSGEFKNVHVKDEEKLEVSKLLSRVPVPIKEGADEPAAKVNALLQAYISRLKLDGFAMVADMTYIQQSACRLMRAIFEISLKRGWAALTIRVLTICQMLERRSWFSQSPLRQFGAIPEVLLRKMEKSADIPWGRFYDLKPADLGEMVGIPKMGKTLHKYVHMFPRCELNAHVLPITRSLLKVHLSIVPDFQFENSVHDGAVSFHIICEDGNGDAVLHHEMLTLYATRAAAEHIVSFSVPMSDPPPPQYFVRLVADRWLQAETVLPISFRHLVLPQKFPPPTQLLDLQPLPTSALPKSIRPLFASFKHFNPVQTQVFSSVYESDASVLICAPTGAGKTVCAELALLRLLQAEPAAKAVYLCVKQEQADQAYTRLSERLCAHLGVQGVKLTGETSADIKLLDRGSVIVATAAQWDVLSRRWKQRKHVQQISLYIADDVHLMAGRGGSVLEIVLSRARYVATQYERHLRIVALGVSMANARDVGDWLGVAHSDVFNFPPDVRSVPLEIKLQGFDSVNVAGRLLAMSKYCYQVLMRLPQGKPSIVFVPSLKQAQLSAIDIITFAVASGDPHRFLNTTSANLEPVLSTIREEALRQVVLHGVGYLHRGLLNSDRQRVENLYRDGILSVLVVPYDLCYGLPAPAYCTVIMDTVYFDGRQHQYVDYSINDVLHMVGTASRPLQDDSAKCVLLVHSPKKEYLKKLLHEPLPVESTLDHDLHDHICAEVVSGTIESKQDAVDYMTWTFYYRRLTRNPNYYNVVGTTDSHLSDHLSELVESTVSELEESKCILVENDMDLSPLNLGLVATHYYIHYTTIELFISSVTERTKTRGAIEVLCAATEFGSLPLRQSEEDVMRHLAAAMPYRIPDSASFNDPATKAMVLVYAHLSRMVLPGELPNDLKVLLKDSMKLIQALADVVASQSWLKPALAVMELSQMLVQGLWERESMLLQIPHFDVDIVARLKDAGVETVFDVLEMEDEDRGAALQLSPKAMSDVAMFCNSYPSIELNFETDLEEGTVAAGDVVTVSVELQREVDEDDAEEVARAGTVVSSRFPFAKTESWWLVVGDKAANSLLCIKRVALTCQGKYRLQFNAPDALGAHALTLYLMSDSYLGCDQEYNLSVSVIEGGSDEEDDEDEG